MDVCINRWMDGKMNKNILFIFFHSSDPDGSPKRQVSVTNPNNKEATQDTELKKI